MIELNKKTQQDFLNREWVQRLLDAGVNMDDAKYCIVKTNIDYVCLKSAITPEVVEWIPTYTVSELLYKLHEWIYPTIDGQKYSGGLTMLKDAPFYIFYYDLQDKFTQEGEHNTEYIWSGFEYPIESLAGVLIQCHQKDIGCGMPDVGNISSK